MTVTTIGGTPIVPIGMPYLNANYNLPGAGSFLMDAALEATIEYGYIITDDGGSHTIDTTGSSSLGWKTASVTFANAGTSFVVGLATMDAGNGPPGRATNVADLITFSVSKTMTGGGGGVTANAWQTHVPDAGTMTVANGDLIAFCTQMVTRGGADVVNAQLAGPGISMPLPGATTFTSSTYAAAANVPNVLITFSDGHLGWIYGGNVFLTASTTQTWNNTGTNEFGNFIQLPFPVNIYGIIAQMAVGGNVDVNLYTTPLGTPAAAKTISVDLNTVQSATTKYGSYLFTSPYSATANQPLAAIMTPTSATNITSPYKTFNASSHQVTEMVGTNCYAVSRASGAFAAVNSSKDRFAIGLLVGAFDDGAGSGGVVGVIGS